MTCRWPRGCMQPISLVTEEGGRVELCFYHWKVRQGLIDSRDIRASGRRSTNPSEVVSDDQQETAGALRSLGASEAVVRQALEKRPRMPVGGRNGVGPKRRATPSP